MFGIGLPEMILILALALIVVGPDKLPELARSIAKGIMELKKTAENLKDSLTEEGNPLDDIKPELEDTARKLKNDLLDLPPYERDSAATGTANSINQTAQNAKDAYQELMKQSGLAEADSPVDDNAATTKNDATDEQTSTPSSAADVNAGESVQQPAVPTTDTKK